MIRPRWIYFILPLLCMALQARAAALHTLQSMARIDEFDQSRIVLDFSELPEFRLESSGQRLDLILERTEIAPSLRLLTEDDKIVKVLLAAKPDALLVSILLHKIPARVVAEKSSATRQVTLDIRWNTDGARRPAIAFQISGMPSAHPTLDGVATPGERSPYNGHWRDFFGDSHTPVRLEVPIRPSMPALPLRPVTAKESETSPLVPLAETGQWQTILEKHHQQPSEPAANLSTLLHAEALLRTGHAEAALDQLDPWGPDSAPSPLLDRAIYLRALAQARLGLPYDALCTLAPLVSREWPSAALAPFVHLLDAEMLLAAGKVDQAHAALDRPARDWPKSLQRAIRWRQAEALALSGKAGKAERLFRTLFSRAEDPYAQYPDLLYHAGRASLAAGRYRQAENCFQALMPHLASPVDQGMTLFLAARAAYLGNDKKRAMVVFEQLRDNFEGTEPGFRAWMALLDHRMLQPERSQYAQLASDYAEISAQAPFRLLREEAAFKRILAYHLSGQRERAANLLQDFLRNFAHGPLNGEARALLSEFLPPLIQELIGKGKDMQAVTLVERNRNLLINGNLAWPFLPDLARAYTRLGLWDKACKIYFFMIDRETGRRQQADHYLPLVSLLMDRGRYAMAASFAQRYRDKHPSGPDRESLFLLQLEALLKTDRLDEAAGLLAEKHHPSNDAITLLSARIFQLRGEPASIVALPAGLNASPEGMLLRAEALYQTGAQRAALDLYGQLLAQNAYADQALYRSGQIRLDNGEKREAIKLLTQLTETKPTSMWGRLAGDMLAAEKMP